MKGSRIVFLALSAAMLMTLWGCGSNKGSDGFQTAAETPEEIARATSFVGADRCGGCHETTHEGWAATAHTQKLRTGDLEVNYSNDGNGSGRSDFFDAAEVDVRDWDGAGNKYDAYGTNAPVLGSDFSGAYVKIGAAKHYVVFAMGGSATHAIGESDASDTDGNGLILNDEAQWKQRYVTKIGNSHYILPVQFNQQTGEYTTYDTDGKWYDADTKLPLEKPSNNNSYERRCAGCHLTGLEVALQGDEWTMEFSDMSVACEACHGPGGQHATSPNKDNIVNPATMTTDLDLNGDGNVDQLDNLTVRNYVCFPCHSRGAGKYTANDTTVSYSSKAGPNNEVLMYLPGLDWAEYYDISEKGSDYWGGTPTSDAFVTSKSHHQQQQDLMAGPHAPDKSYDHECFVCHDMHSTANKSMVASEMVADGITIAVKDSASKYSSDGNNLCLSCHAGHGDFEALSVVDVSSDSPLVAEVGKAHMAKRAGKARWLDDSKSMFSCTSCHMPKTAKSAIFSEVGTGVLDENGDEIMEVVGGDIRSHVLTIVWPSLSETNPGMPNACNACHNGDSTAPDPAVSQKTAGTAIIRDWAKSGHGDESGEAWMHYDWDAEDRQDCQQCHTATGAMNYFTDPANYDAANNEFNLPEGKNQVLYCYGCHSDNMNGTDGDGFGTAVHAPGALEVSFTVDGVNPTLPDLGATNICVSCHSGRGNMDSLVGTDGAVPALDMAGLKPGFGPGTTNATKTHYLAAAGTIFQAATRSGYEYAGQSYADVGYFAHAGIGLNSDAPETGAGPCAACHMETEGSASHTFAVVDKDADGVITNLNSAACAACHKGAYGAALLSPGKVGAMFTFDNPGYAGTTDRVVTQADIDAAGAFLETEAEGYHGALAALESALVANGLTFAPSYPYFSGDSWINQGVFGAAHNYNYLHHEPGAYAHNRYYAKRLIFDSIDWLDNFTLDGTLTLDPVADAHAIHWLGGDAATGVVAARP